MGSDSSLFASFVLHFWFSVDAIFFRVVNFRGQVHDGILWWFYHDSRWLNRASWPPEQNGGSCGRRSSLRRRKMANPSDGQLTHFSTRDFDALGKFFLSRTTVLRFRIVLLQVRSGRNFCFWTDTAATDMALGPSSHLDGVNARRHRGLRLPVDRLWFCGSRHTIRFDRTKMLTHIRADVVLCVGVNLVIR